MVFMQPQECPSCSIDDLEAEYDENEGLWQVTCPCGTAASTTLSESGAVVQWNMIRCDLSETDVGEQLYYVQDTRDVVGNCLSWWGVGRKGYTCELDRAGKYTAAQIASMRPDVDVAWPVEYVDAHAIRHFRTDMEGIERPAGIFDAGKECASDRLSD